MDYDDAFGRAIYKLVPLARMAVKAEEKLRDYGNDDGNFARSLRDSYESAADVVAFVLSTDLSKLHVTVMSALSREKDS